MRKACFLVPVVLFMAGCLPSTDPGPPSSHPNTDPPPSQTNPERPPSQDSEWAFPANGSLVDPLHMEFIWKARKDPLPAPAFNYQIQIASDSAYFAPEYRDSLLRTQSRRNVQDTNYQMTLFPHYPVYYWRIVYIQGVGFPTVASKVRWCVSRDTSRDIDFLNPKPGQYSEWEFYSPERSFPHRMGIQVVGDSGTYFELLQAVDDTISSAYLIPRGKGYAYWGSLKAFTLSQTFPDGFATRDTSRIFSYPDFAKTVSLGSSSSGNFTARDTDFNPQGRRYGPTDFLVSHFSNATAEVAQLTATGLDSAHGLVYAKYDIGNWPDVRTYYRVKRPRPPR